MHHGNTSSESWADLDSPLIALYVTIDDLLGRPGRLPGRQPKLSDSELACLAVAQVLLSCPSEHRWLRFAMVRLRHLFPYLPQQPGYNKRLRALSPLLSRVLRHLARQTPSWCDRLRLLDATPLPCASSRETVERSALRGHANYGYCASHSRYFWGFKLTFSLPPTAWSWTGVWPTPSWEKPRWRRRSSMEARWRKARSSSATKASPTASCKQGWPSWGPLCSVPIARMSLLATTPWARSASGSRASSTPSRDSSRSKSTAAVPRPGLWRG